MSQTHNHMASDLASATESAHFERAQAVRCGERWIAFPHGWAHKAVEDISLSAVPGAPHWLAGAVNVDGRVVPVVDLLAWQNPTQFINAQANTSRLLVGGQGSHVVGVLFEGLPRLVPITRDAVSRAPVHDDRLAPYITGQDPSDDAVLAIDAYALVEALIEELALR